MNKLFSIFVCIVFLMGCGGENSSTTSASSNPDATATTQPQQMHFKADHETPYCRLWVVKMAVEVPDPPSFKGRWFDLKKDGTFASGHWSETNNSGTWGIDEASKIISFVFDKPDAFPTAWKIQGAGGGGRILWKGNVPGNEIGAQVMLEEETAIPSKPPQ